MLLDRSHQCGLRPPRFEGLHLVSAPVQATAFGGRQVAWFMGADGVLIELLERGAEGEL